MKRIKLDNFKRMMGKATSRKGMGMELALLVLFVVFACSILLVSSAMLDKSNLMDWQDDLALRFELDQFAEHILAGGDDESEKFNAVKRGSSLEIKDADENVLLTVEWNGSNIITRWEYS